MKYLTMIAVLFSAIFSNVSAFEDKIENPITTEKEYELKTWEEFVFFVGCDCPDDFNPKNYSDKAKEHFIEKGLSILKKQQTQFSFTMLTKYYIEESDMAKALYWALLGAENGCGFCMTVLRHAYAAGDGVVQDTHEAIKWAYLAAAKDEEARKFMEEFSKKHNGEHSTNLLFEGRKRAQEWMNSHPKAFFEPN